MNADQNRPNRRAERATSTNTRRSGNPPLATRTEPPTYASRQVGVPSTVSKQPSPNPGRLGVRIRDVAPGTVRITGFDPGSPAPQAGLQIGDRLVSIADAPTPSTAALIRQVKSHSAGETVGVGVIRGNNHYLARVTLIGNSANRLGPDDRSRNSPATSPSSVGRSGVEELSGVVVDASVVQREDASGDREDPTADDDGAERHTVPTSWTAPGFADDTLEFGDQEPTDSYLFAPDAEFERDRQ